MGSDQGRNRCSLRNHEGQTNDPWTDGFTTKLSEKGTEGMLNQMHYIKKIKNHLIPTVKHGDKRAMVSGCFMLAVVLYYITVL